MFRDPLGNLAQPTTRATFGGGSITYAVPAAVAGGTGSTTPRTYVAMGQVSSVSSSLTTPTTAATAGPTYQTTNPYSNYVKSQSNTDSSSNNTGNNNSSNNNHTSAHVIHKVSPMTLAAHGGTKLVGSWDAPIKTGVASPAITSPMAIPTPMSSSFGYPYLTRSATPAPSMSPEAISMAAVAVASTSSTMTAGWSRSQQQPIVLPTTTAVVPMTQTSVGPTASSITQPPSTTAVVRLQTAPAVQVQAQQQQHQQQHLPIAHIAVATSTSNMSPRNTVGSVTRWSSGAATIPTPSPTVIARMTTSPVVSARPSPGQSSFRSTLGAPVSPRLVTSPRPISPRIIGVTGPSRTVTLRSSAEPKRTASPAPAPTGTATATATGAKSAPASSASQGAQAVAAAIAASSQPSATGGGGGSTPPTPTFTFGGGSGSIPDGNSAPPLPRFAAVGRFGHEAVQTLPKPLSPRLTLGDRVVAPKATAPLTQENPQAPSAPACSSPTKVPAADREGRHELVTVPSLSDMGPAFSSAVSTAGGDSPQRRSRHSPGQDSEVIEEILPLGKFGVFSPQGSPPGSSASPHRQQHIITRATYQDASAVTAKAAAPATSLAAETPNTATASSPTTKPTAAAATPTTTTAETVASPQQRQQQHQEDDVNSSPPSAARSAATASPHRSTPPSACRGKDSPRQGSLSASPNRREAATAAAIMAAAKASPPGSPGHTRIECYSPREVAHADPSRLAILEARCRQLERSLQSKDSEHANKVRNLEEKCSRAARELARREKQVDELVAQGIALKRLLGEKDGAGTGSNNNNSNVVPTHSGSSTSSKNASQHHGGSQSRSSSSRNNHNNNNNNNNNNNSNSSNSRHGGTEASTSAGMTAAPTTGSTASRPGSQQRSRPSSARSAGTGGRNDSQGGSCEMEVGGGNGGSGGSGGGGAHTRASRFEIISSQPSGTNARKDDLNTSTASTILPTKSAGDGEGTDAATATSTTSTSPRQTHPKGISHSGGPGPRTPIQVPRAPGGSMEIRPMGASRTGPAKRGS
mmetsp:Transcript_12831/g.28417  ORF Transcript_12831/g.28417 Transcript_12831/m.28417 type:complete len:1036 (-) Transcript_12831:104-3211(-)